MRYYGTITRWNSKRGFGAATIEDTGQEIFLALAAFTTLTRLPAEGQHISFNITEGRRGRKEAENVCFALDCADCFDVLVPPPENPLAGKQAIIGLIAVIFVCGIFATLWYGLHFSDNTPEEPAIKKQETMVHEVAAKIEAERKAWRDAVNRSNQRSGQPQRAKDNTSKQ